jgi:hypothetical protein
MVLAAALVFASGFGQLPKGAPSWLDERLGGLELGSRARTVRRDPTSGFYLCGSIECDGALQSLELTRDRHDVQNFQNYDDNDQPVSDKVAKFPLKTGKGLSIGDSQAKVRATLGLPTASSRVGPKGKYVEYAYRCSLKVNGRATKFEETYTFKKNRLIQILFFLDSSDLGDEDS